MHVLDKNPNETSEHTIVQHLYKTTRNPKIQSESHKIKNRVDESQNPKFFQVFGAEELEGGRREAEEERRRRRLLPTVFLFGSLKRGTWAGP